MSSRDPNPRQRAVIREAKARQSFGLQAESFTVQTADVGHWEGRYFVFDWPTYQLPRPARSYTPSKYAART